MQRGTFIGTRLLALLGACGCCTTQHAAELHPSLKETLNTVQELDQFLDVITAEYPETVERKQLWRGALAGMAQVLGPGCVYRPPHWKDTTPDILADTQQNQIDDHTWQITGLHPTHLLAQRGFVPGSSITLKQCEAIKQELHASTGSSDSSDAVPAVPLLAAKNNTEDNNTAQKKAVANETLQRRAGILAASVERHTAYIRIATIDDIDTNENNEYHTAAVIKPWLLTKNNLAAVVLDLRDCWGKSARGAAHLADLFLRDHPHKAIVTVELAAKKPSRAQRWEAQAGDTLPDIPVIVIINRWTSHSAVALAASLQDHGRAVLIGENSGPAMGQRVNFAGPHGGSLILRVTNYRSPNGTNLLRGIEPDILTSDNQKTTSLQLAQAMILQRQLERR